MKKLFSIFILLSFVVIGNAQVNTKPKLNELSEDQLNRALSQSNKTIKTGKTLTFTGLGFASLGMLFGIPEAFGNWSDPNSHNTNVWGILGATGVITMFGGIPVWIAGASKKHKIALELLKFYPPGSASINGVGLRIRF